MKRRFVNITMAALYLPGYIATSLAANLDFTTRDMFKRPIIVAVLIAYWLILLLGATLIITAYVSK